MISSKQTAEHYNWGQNCDGWHLLKSNTLSVIEERLPFNSSEKLHYHERAQQLFYILSGTATFTIANETIIVNANQSIHIAKKTVHKISNNYSDDLCFLVISEPKSHEDRIDV
ncbi:MAG: cupin domain-containing protein [Chitinophagaceae bacterium]|nr:cupin domain-containing protein [Chitinophagaceae bacterium]